MAEGDDFNIYGDLNFTSESNSNTQGSGVSASSAAPTDYDEDFLISSSDDVPAHFRPSKKYRAEANESLCNPLSSTHQRPPVAPNPSSKATQGPLVQKQNSRTNSSSKDFANPPLKQGMNHNIGNKEEGDQQHAPKTEEKNDFLNSGGDPDDLQNRFDQLNKRHEALRKNISCVFRTAKEEISRKDKEILRLREM